MIVHRQTKRRHDPSSSLGVCWWEGTSVTKLTTALLARGVDGRDCPGARPLGSNGLLAYKSQKVPIIVKQHT